MHSRLGKASLVAATIALVGLFSASADAAQKPLPNCGSGDLSGVPFLSCAGYSDGNLISGNASDQVAVNNILTSLGLSGTGGIWLEKLDGLGGSTSINFATPLNGITYLGIHKGNGGIGGEGTAFYKINAGTNLDIITYNLGASSNAALYATAPVPEPESWVMLMAGLGLVGWTARRRRQSGL